MEYSWYRQEPTIGNSLHTFVLKSRCVDYVTHAFLAKTHVLDELGVGGHGDRGVPYLELHITIGIAAVVDSNLDRRRLR